eukprot:m.720439 g.720439  ORF g.720439 m.720439 type:complete len:68 (-) comp23004_c1_seq3:188-391(-)
MSRFSFPYHNCLMYLTTIQVHGDTCGAMPHLSDDIQATLDQQEECWLRLEGLFQHSLCAVNFFKGTV